jgi:hypothetical protein
MGLPTLFIDLRNILSGIWRKREAPPPIQPRKPEYALIQVAPTTPPSDAIGIGDFYWVVHQGVDYWSLFRCPCTCGEVISLPLQSSHRPHWQLERSASGRPTLNPSVWRNKGCKSHFWIKDGFVLWCRDSGLAPHVARPDLYSERPPPHS